MKPPQPNQPKVGLLQAGWLTVILIALSAAVGQAFGRFSYGVLLPAVRDDLGISNTLAGLIGAANVGAYLLGTLMVAWATSHYRLINVMRVGLILATLGLLLASLSSSPWLLAMALFVAGIGGALLWIPAPVIAADALPPPPPADCGRAYGFGHWAWGYVCQHPKRQFAGFSGRRRMV